jgi:hypothetical protein
MKREDFENLFNDANYKFINGSISNGAYTNIVLNIKNIARMYGYDLSDESVDDSHNQFKLADVESACGYNHVGVSANMTIDGIQYHFEVEYNSESDSHIEINGVKIEDLSNEDLDRLYPVVSEGMVALSYGHKRNMIKSALSSRSELTALFNIKDDAGDDYDAFDSDDSY